MILWRISNHASLDGRGGLIASARWHTRGRPVVYLAETPAGALMETVVHLELNDGIVPDTYQLLRVAVPERVSRRLIEISSLEPDWAERSGYTRGLGDRWIREAGTALLGVPSAIVPETTNWLLNPRHPDAAEARIEWGRRFGFDQRFFSFSVPTQ